MCGLARFVCGKVLKKCLQAACGRPHSSHRCRISAGADPQATTMGLFVPSPSLVTLSAACQEQKYSTHKEGPLPPGPHWQIPGLHGPRGVASSPAERGPALLRGSQAKGSG